MDPKIVLAELLAALIDRDTEGARASFEDLADWLDAGGFIPPDIAGQLERLTEV